MSMCNELKKCLRYLDKTSFPPLSSSIQKSDLQNNSVFIIIYYGTQINFLNNIFELNKQKNRKSYKI